MPTYLEPVERELLMKRNNALGAAHHPAGTVDTFETCRTGQAIGTQSGSTKRVTQAVVTGYLVKDNWAIREPLFHPCLGMRVSQKLEIYDARLRCHFP